MSVEKLNEVMKDLRESDVPESLWPAALRELLRVRLATHVAQVAQTQEHTGSSGDLAGSWAERIAARIRAPVDQIIETYDLDDDGFRITVPAGRLPDRRAPAMRMLALLVAGGRQAGNVDEGWTSVAVIRDVCREYGVLDQTNFATEIGNVDTFAFKGSGQRRQVKVTVRGFEELGNLIRTLSAR